MHQTADINIVTNRVLPTPAELHQAVPRTEPQSDSIVRRRREIHDIIFGDDQRLLFVAGPCSIHDVEAGREYARRLARLADAVRDRMLVMMRVYFEKPRTTVGWKGLIMDPHLDGSGDIPAGLRLARTFLRDVIDLGLPTATELLDPITPQYIADLICWSAVGARTTESQTHRQMASGLSMPLGFKNGTDGNIQSAINAIRAASQPQTFLGVSMDGRASAVTTRGNPNCHIVLRGGRDGPNYSPVHLDAVEAALAAASLPRAVLIDCSHDNSGKKPERQPEVLRAVVDQLADGRASIIGTMIESNLEPGNQPITAQREQLRFGISVTDGCIGWAETEATVHDTYERLAPRFR